MYGGRPGSVLPDRRSAPRLTQRFEASLHSWMGIITSSARQAEIQYSELGALVYRQALKIISRFLFVVIVFLV